MNDRRDTIVFLEGTCDGISIVRNALVKKHDTYIERGKKTLANEVFSCIRVCDDLLKTMQGGKEVMEQPISLPPAT